MKSKSEMRLAAKRSKRASETLLLFEVVIVVGMQIGCCPTVPAHLPEKISRLIVYSIDGVTQNTGEGSRTTAFPYYPILGELEILDASVQAELITALNDDLGRCGDSPKCYRPRHAIRLLTNDREIELVICYECSNAYLYENGDRKVKVIGNKSMGPINRILRNANIKLAPTS